MTLLKRLGRRPFASLRGLRAQPLHRQLVLLLSAVLLGGALAWAAVAAKRLDRAAQAEDLQWSQALARAAAGQAADALERNDADAVEAALRDLAAMPAVRQIHVRDRYGATLLVLEHTSDGRVLRSAGAAAHADAARAWAGAGAGSGAGSIGVAVRTPGALSALRNDALLGALLLGLPALLAAGWFGARIVRPLRQLAAFAHGLAAGDAGHPAGAGRAAVAPRSAEIGALAAGLNHAAATIRDQLGALREHESARGALLNGVPDVLLGMDEQCRVQVANPAVRAVFGIEPDQAIGVPLEQLLPEVDAAAALARTTQGLYMHSTRSHVVRFEIDARRCDGTAFPVEVSLTRTETADGCRYAALVRDITEARMARDLVHLYGRALECSANGVVISDVTLPGQPVFYANPAFLAITGYGPEDIIGRNCGVLQREDRQQNEIAELRRAIAERRSAQVVLRNYRKDGTLFFNELSISPVVEADGSVQHYVGVIDDVSERERARMAIAERSARLNAVFELSPDGFVVFDAQSRLVFCNRAFLSMTGWQDADVQGLALSDFEARMLALSDAGQAPRAVQEALADDGDTPDTLLLVRPQRRVLARLARRLRDGPVETILFFRDVTRETEVDRMKSEFLTTAAHELRTPMVSVFGFTELLLRRAVSEERRRDMLETIHRQASLLIHMVNELLDLARIEARQGKDINRAPCRVAELVEAALQPLRLGPRALDLAVDLDDGDALLCVDAEKTRQALGNVLSNAVKYSPGGGPIVVATRRGELDGREALGIRIADRGIGMTPEQVARVFERFYRADPSGNIPGTGLGMSLVKEIVELHGGRVDVRSEAGQGTAVTLWWTLEDVPQPATAG